MDKTLELVKELDGLIKQATEERSHYYVKSVAEKARRLIVEQAILIEALLERSKP